MPGPPTLLGFPVVLDETLGRDEVRFGRGPVLAHPRLTSSDPADALTAEQLRAFRDEVARVFAVPAHHLPSEPWRVVRDRVLDETARRLLERKP